jgi:hypothetical protein
MQLVLLLWVVEFVKNYFYEEKTFSSYSTHSILLPAKV